MRSVCTSTALIITFLCKTLPLFAQQGLRDTSFNVGTGANNITQRLELLYDQSVFAGGDFTSFNGAASKRMKRLAPDGSSLPGWAPHTPVTGGADGPVRASAIQADHKLLVGGLFNTINGVASKNFARLDTSGDVDISFNIGAGFNNEVTSIATNGSRIFAAGFFSAYRGITVPGFVCLNLTGDIDTSWLKPSGFPAINAIVTAPGGNVYIGGSFTSYNGVAVNRIARLRTDGTLDTTFNTGTGVTGGNIEAMCLQPDGKLIIAGTFSSVNGSAAVRIARLNTNGSIDVSFNTGSGLNSTARAVTIQHNTGHIYIGGDFTTVNGASSPRIARLLSNGTLDTSFMVGSGFNGTVYSILVQNDGNVLVSGNFTQYSGNTAGKIIRLTGDSTTALPVSLIKFNAEKINEREVLLSWSTASENNNSHFEIEHASGNRIFEQIGLAKGAGNTSTETRYVYTDKQTEPFTEPVCYYRLKQVDMDGKYVYSNVLKVDHTRTNLLGTVVFPNPANDNIVLKGVPAGGLEIHDVTGKILITVSKNGIYDIRSLTPGLYFIRSENGVIKFIVE